MIRKRILEVVMSVGLEEMVLAMLLPVGVLVSIVGKMCICV